MKKIILYTALLAILTSCNHSNGAKPIDLNNSVIPEFSWLLIDYGQVVAPQWIDEMVVIRNTPQIERIVTAGAWNEDNGQDMLEEICKGIVPLKQEEYDEILELVKAANLETYAPPEDCDILYGSSGITVRYGTTDGSEYMFNTVCELEPEIDALVNGVHDIASQAIPDCYRGLAEEQL